MDKKLEQLINNENTYFIHYASNGFYNGSSPAPKVSCIIIYNLKNDKCINSGISEHLDNDLLGTDCPEDVAKIYDEVEKWLKAKCSN